jgi:NAD(P)-dependent dehydrogenase (short-subunit alcohol dehydrogenase family)
MRLEGKIAVIVGAGQSPGEGMGNGRTTTLRFAQEGARILAVVGVSIAGGDKPLDELTEDAFDHVCAINLRGTIMACKGATIRPMWISSGN